MPENLLRTVVLVVYCWLRVYLLVVPVCVAVLGCSEVCGCTAVAVDRMPLGSSRGALGQVGVREALSKSCPSVGPFNTKRAFTVRQYAA